MRGLASTLALIVVLGGLGAYIYFVDSERPASTGIEGEHMSDLGAAAANGIARNLVVPAHRTGGQAQFITPPAQPRVPEGLAATLEWARARLDQPLTVRELADHAGLSTRQLARRMQAELQTGPLDWLHQQRISRAQELLERTDASIDQIAGSCGMGTAATLRRHFHRALGVTPTTYRTTFRLAD